jgi:uncharacterized membrane protein YvbJ
MSEEVTKQETAPVQQQAKTEKKKMSTKKKVFVVLGALVGVFIVLVIIANTATQGVVTASNTMVNAIQASDADAAYGMLSTGAKETISEADFDAVIAQIGPILNTEEKMISKEVAAETGQTSSGKVSYEIKGTDGITYIFDVNLVKENDIWKVLNFDSNEKK